MKIFWSWQSDTPGKTGRHFIRDTLRAAIEELKQSHTIEEPQERERRNAIHLDQDRQGVAGSPDLAATIFKKIEETSVFISDVTPVAETNEREDEEGNKYTKKVMNPNAAIELGYALHCLGDNAVLMVMNNHYGKRNDLPFDLAHKAGPIIFSLPPDATKDQIKLEAKSLKNKLIEALTPYLKHGSTFSAKDQPETLQEKSKRIEKEINAKKARMAFLASAAGVQAALNSLQEIYSGVLKRVELLPFQCDTRNDIKYRLFLLCEKVGMSFDWYHQFINTLDDSSLTIAVWRGAPPIPGNFRFDEPSKISSRVFVFDRDLNENIGWTEKGYPEKFFSADQLADYAIDVLIERINEMHK